MSPALTAQPWSRAFDYYRQHATDRTVAEMAEMLYDIVNSSDDPVVADIINSHAFTILERT